MTNLLTSAEYNDMEFSANADELFDSQYTTATLLQELLGTVHPRTDHPARVAAESDVWFRGAIVKALDHLGVTVSTINRRHS